MTNLKTKYDFKEVEDNRYQSWLKERYFESGNIEKSPLPL